MCKTANIIFLYLVNYESVMVDQLQKHSQGGALWHVYFPSFLYE